MVGADRRRSARGTRSSGPGLEAFELDGVAYYGPSKTLTRSGDGRAHLLSIYDEYISSYRDRSAICDPAFGKRLVGMGAALAYVIVVDGWIAGTWQRSVEKRTVKRRASRRSES